MAERTPNYGLLKISQGDAMSAEGYAFGYDNIDVIDLALTRLRDHSHDGAALSLADPTLAPVLDVVASTSGGIPAGVTVRYRYSYVDADGAETAASIETSTTTPAPIIAPPSPTLSKADTGGTVAAGNTIYGLSAYLDSNTNETVLGETAFITLVQSTSVVTLTLPALPSGADGFNVYRRTPGQATLYYLASVDMTVATPPTEYIDDGATAIDETRQSSFVNTTNSNNIITVSLPGATPVVPANATWKVYRTYDNTFTNSLLHHVVEETSPGSGVIVTEYEDNGTGTLVGTPLDFSRLYQNPPKIGLGEIGFGDYTTYVPTFTNVTIGNGVWTRARYTQIGKVVFVDLNFTFGSSTVVTGSPIQISLPLTSAWTFPGVPFPARLLGGGFQGGAVILSNTDINIVAINVAGTYAQYVNTTSAIPGTWANTHVIQTTFNYEVP